MKLYHYANKIHSPLLTRNAQGNVSRKDYQKSLEEAKRNVEPGSYYDHVSFFFEPIPLKEIGDIFEGTSHPVWNNGQELYEHIIDSSQLPADMFYQVVETPLLQKFWGDKNLSSLDSDLIWDNALKQAKELQIKHKEWGTNVADLVNVGMGLEKGILDYYRKSKEGDGWESNQKRYAADVPHVMIYSKGGTFPVVEVNKVKIGSSIKKKISIENIYK